MILNFSKKILPLVVAGIFIVLPLSNSYGNQRRKNDREIKMHNALGMAYSAASKQDKALALEWFKKAGRFAEKARSWQGCIDSGYGLLALDEDEQAIPLFDKAFEFAQRQMDWRACVACGYAYSSVQVKLGTKQKSAKAFKHAGKLSAKNENWRGLIESGKGLVSLGMPREAIEYYDQAFLTAKTIESAEGLGKIENCYQKVTEMEKAEECNRISTSLSAPPPGWEALGETIASPGEISPEIQKASRRSTDQEISDKDKWFLEQKKAEIKQEQEANTYSNYYFPYRNYYGWQPYYGPWVRNWGLFYLSNYYYYRNGFWWRPYYY